MRKFLRNEEPDFLKSNWEEWEERRKVSRAASFHWHQISGRSVNEILLPILKHQTQDHCSFCDNFPVSPPSIETIEHFRPKSKFPRDAYRWENLFFCCMYCQQKGDGFDELMLRPDAEEYFLNRYFRFDYTLGTIEPNPRASSKDQERARLTIKFYRLNERHPTFRKLWMARRAKLRDEDIDTFPYRDYLEGS